MIAMLKCKIEEAERLQRERDECTAPTTPPTLSELAAEDARKRLLGLSMGPSAEQMRSKTAKLIDANAMDLASDDASSKAVLVNAAEMFSVTTASDKASAMSDDASDIAPSDCTSAAATWLNTLVELDVEGVVLKDGKYFTKDGVEMTAKWAKRMRQRMQQRQAAALDTPGSSSSCAAAVPAKKPRNNEPVKPGGYQARALASSSASAAAAPQQDVKLERVIEEDPAGDNKLLQKVVEVAEAAASAMEAAAASAMEVAGPKRELREGWPKVRCATCPATDHWRRMKEETNVQFLHEKKGDGKEDVYQTVYFCAGCVSTAKGITHAEAQAEIQLTRYSMVKRTARQAEYKHAKAHIMAEFPSMSNKEACKLGRDRLSKVMQPLAVHIARKDRIMQMRGKLLGRHRELADKLAQTSDRRECDKLLDEMEALEDEIDAAAEPLAFQNRVLNTMAVATDEERRRAVWEYRLAAQYSDLWCEIKDRRGRRIGALMSYYVCLAGGSEYPCGTVMEASAWDRLHPDPLQAKQRWYCNVCSAKFRCKFGVLLQVMLPPCDAHPQGSTQWMRAEVPDRDHEDVRAMRLEEEFDPASPLELYNKVRASAKPSTTDGMLRQALPHELCKNAAQAAGTFRIVPLKEFVAMELFPWDQIFNFAR